MPEFMTLHIENLPTASVTDALVALEWARKQGLFDAEQIERLATLVACMRLSGERITTEVGRVRMIPERADYVRHREGWATWLPFTLMECHRCSALVMNNDMALDNHDAWHAHLDGSDA